MPGRATAREERKRGRERRERGSTGAIDPFLNIFYSLKKTTEFFFDLYTGYLCNCWTQATLTVIVAVMHGLIAWIS